MYTIRQFFLHEWMKLVVPAGVLGATLAAGWAFKRILFGALRRWAARTKSQAGAMMTEALDGSFLIWVLILAIHLAMESSDLPARATHWSSRILLVLWILSFTMVAVRLAGDLIRFYGNGVQGALPAPWHCRTRCRTCSPASTLRSPDRCGWETTSS